MLGWRNARILRPFLSGRPRGCSFHASFCLSAAASNVQRMSVFATIDDALRKVQAPGYAGAHFYDLLRSSAFRTLPYIFATWPGASTIPHHVSRCSCSLPLHLYPNGLTKAVRTLPDTCSFFSSKFAKESPLCRQQKRLWARASKKTILGMSFEKNALLVVELRFEKVVQWRRRPGLEIVQHLHEVRRRVSWRSADPLQAVQHC